MKGYGVRYTIKNAFCLFYNKMFWKNARLAKSQILARSRNNIEIAKGFTCG